MGSIIGIPTTRVSDLFIRRRLTDQIQLDQLKLFETQMKLSTGRRIQAPSEDAPAAMRIISLQRLLERKSQIRANVETNQSYMAATDATLSTVSGSLAEARGAALSVIGAIATDTQRQAAAQQIQQTLQRIVDIGNQKFRGRYLFTGAGTVVRPFEINGTNVEYQGDEKKLSSYADLNLLFESNLHGSEVFGAISQPVLGTQDLNPTLNYDTRLADLRGGKGITRGSILISDGSQNTTIDITSAETIGDVAAFIRANPPTGRTVNVEITATGLKIDLANPNPGDVLTMREVGGGTTADELGILTGSSPGTTINGSDLDPVVRLTTRVADVFGTKAYAVVRSGKPDADLVFTAQANNTLNGTQIVFQNAAVPGVSYAGGTLTFDIVAGNTTAQDIIDLLEASPWGGPGDEFSVRLDPTDASKGDGSGHLSLTNPASPPTMTGGGGDVLDLASGLQIVNGGKTHTIDLSTAETFDDVLNILNMSDAGVLAEINEDATGIDIRSRLSGDDFMIGENGGTTASDLGLRTFTAATRLEDLNHEIGVETQTGIGDFTITRSDGVTLDIDVTGLQTIDDVLDAVNNHAANVGNVVTAQLVATGNGIELIEAAPGAGTLRVDKAVLSMAAIGLGLIPEGQDFAEATAAAGTQTLTGTDVNPLETEGMFTSLLRLETALRANDVPEIERAIGLLDDALIQMNFVRAEFGARQQSLDITQFRLEDENVDLQEALSLDFDSDLVEVTSELTGRQIAFEASLRSSAAIFQMTLLNYI